MPEITEIGDIQRKIDKKIQVQKAKRTFKGIARGTFKVGKKAVEVGGKAGRFTLRAIRKEKPTPQPLSSEAVGSRFYKSMLPDEKFVHDSKLKLDSMNLKQELVNAKTLEREVKKQKAREQAERLSRILGIGRSTPKLSVEGKKLNLFRPLPRRQEGEPSKINTQLRGILGIGHPKRSKEDSPIRRLIGL